MECRTTWVFPKADFDESVDANVLNRYASEGSVLEVKFPKGKRSSSPNAEQRYDLVYTKAWYKRDQLSDGIGAYVGLVNDMVEKMFPLIKKDGHLAIRTRDVRTKEGTVCPALHVWKIPTGQFRIREIVIATTEPNDEEREPTEELEIAHEYLLVYRKP